MASTAVTPRATSATRHREFVRVQRLMRSWLAAGMLLAGGSGLLLSGCATRNAAPTAEAPDDIAEYQEIVREARASLDEALKALSQVESQNRSCPPGIVATFQREVQDLEVESIKARSRAHAVLARGDAYFEHWHQNMAGLQNAQARQLAEARRPEMLAAFHQLKADSARVRESFRPFMAELRKLRVALENDPNCVAAESVRALIAGIQVQSRQVRQCLDATQQDLDALAALVQPIKSANRK